MAQGPCTLEFPTLFRQRPCIIVAHRKELAEFPSSHVRLYTIASTNTGQAPKPRPVANVCSVHKRRALHVWCTCLKGPNASRRSIYVSQQERAWCTHFGIMGLCKVLSTRNTFCHRHEVDWILLHFYSASRIRPTQVLSAALHPLQRLARDNQLDL